MVDDKAGTGGAKSDPNGKVLKDNFSKAKPISFIERTKTERRKKVYLISEFSGRHNGYGLRARYIGSIPRNPLIRRHTSKSHKKKRIIPLHFQAWIIYSIIINISIHLRTAPRAKRRVYVKITVVIGRIIKRLVTAF